MFWQRVWAAKDQRALRLGGLWGFVITTVVIGFFGLVGFLGLWAGLPPLDDHNNLAFFVPFSERRVDWVKVILVILAATMNESAVDSLQNAIVATLSSNFLVDKPVAWSRAMVFLVNVPIVAVALQGYGLLDIFLVMNVLTTTSALPLLSGLWVATVSGPTVLLACFMSFVSTCVFGCVYAGGFVKGMQWTFTASLNNYDYRIFLMAAGSSLFWLFVGWALLDKRRGEWAAEFGKPINILPIFSNGATGHVLIRRADESYGDMSVLGGSEEASTTATNSPGRDLEHFSIDSD
jgi:hypothetical protein